MVLKKFDTPQFLNPSRKLKYEADTGKMNEHFGIIS